MFTFSAFTLKSGIFSTAFLKSSSFSILRFKKRSFHLLLLITFLYLLNIMHIKNRGRRFLFIKNILELIFRRLFLFAVTHHEKEVFSSLQ